MSQTQSIKVDDKTVVEVRGIEQIDRGELPQRTLSQAREAGDAYFIDVVSVSEGKATIHASGGRDDPERTYWIDGGELYAETDHAGFVLEARVPFTETNNG